MFEFLYFLKSSVEPFLVPLCFVCAWGLIFLAGWSVLGAIASTVSRAQQMHQIPCAKCAFFTGDYHLKCPVQPKIALSEKAIGCIDYRPNYVSWHDQNKF